MRADESSHFFHVKAIAKAIHGENPEEYKAAMSEAAEFRSSLSRLQQIKFRDDVHSLVDAMIQESK